VKIIFRQPVFYFLVILVTIIAGLHFLAFEYYWYWRIEWFDLLMHFMGGVLISVLSVWLYAHFWKKTDIKAIPLRQIVTVALVFSLSIGIAWELFEFGVDRQYWLNDLHLKSLTALQESHADTLSDLAFDILGALFGVLLVWFTPLVRSRRSLVKETLTETKNE